MINKELKVQLADGHKLLVSGATGFVGSALVAELACGNRAVNAAVRQNKVSLPEQVAQYSIGDLSTDINWSPALKGVEVVIHLAARVHVMQDGAMDPLFEFRKINKVATLNFAKQAAKAGVKRFIFLSSIKVNGEMTRFGESFTPDDLYVPKDPYGLSKYEAEQGLLALAQETDMEVVIIRPPLIYGPAVKGNFASMIKWVYRGVPLPFGVVHNSRSLVALDNLVDFIICCIDHPKARNEIFLISDGLDLSTTKILQKVAKAFGKKPLLLPVPVWLMKFVARMVGKGDLAARLMGSLQVDSTKARKLLDWKPLVSMDEQLKKTVVESFDEKNF